MASKPLTNLSSTELFELAKAKEEEELLQERERSKEILRGLRKERRMLIAEQRRALAIIDAKIAAHSGVKNTSGEGNRRSGSSKQVLAVLVSAGGPLSTAAIREGLRTRGVSVGNLGQTLAYLKRRGRVTSPGGALYQAD
jgi:aspartokinase